MVHIWRVRCKQLQDTQEYADILGTGEEADDLKNILSTYNKELQINDAIVEEAQENVPEDIGIIEQIIYNMQKKVNILKI